MTAKPPVARRSYAGITLYAPDRTPCRLDLSDNTNAWGMPPAARAAIVAPDSFARYPSLYADELKGALSTYAGVPIDMVSTGCGSDDILDSTFRAFAEPGEAIAFPDPTFPPIPIFALMNGLRPVPVPTSAGFAPDVDALLETRARIIYVCSPNNPTGNVVSRKAIERLIRRASSEQLIVVDEAYSEFAAESVIDLLGISKRLIISRTMSKAFGLAGLRIGYALGTPALIAEVEKSRGPYKVSDPASRAAVAALGDGLSWVNEHVDAVIANRGRFEAALIDRGVAPVPSSANFVFFPIGGAAAIARAMRERGVAVRPFDEPSGIRVTIGPWPLMLEALAAFDEARRACA
jgi:histidinol-phosphate aminotransferase